MRALLSIDYTNDFVATRGALTTAIDGQNIEKNLVAVTKEFTENGDFVVYAIDCHKTDDLYHPEQELFPPHNIEGKAGRELYGSLLDLYESTKDHQNVYWIDKRHYSAFSGTDLDIRLRERGVTEVHLTGVCTDICVLHTAVDAYNLGYKIFVRKDAVASFDPVGHSWALNHFKSVLGAEIVD